MLIKVDAINGSVKLNMLERASRSLTALFSQLAHMAFVYCFSLQADFFSLKCAGAKNR